MSAGSGGCGGVHLIFLRSAFFSMNVWSCGGFFDQSLSVPILPDGSPMNRYRFDLPQLSPHFPLKVKGFLGDWPALFMTACSILCANSALDMGGT